MSAYETRTYRFRSHVAVEFGEPITIAPDMVAAYSAGKEEKRRACAALLDRIYKALSGVTVSAPDYERLQLIQFVRRLYNPPGALRSCYRWRRSRCLRSIFLLPRLSLAKRR